MWPIFSVHCTVETGLVQYDTLYAAHLIKFQIQILYEEVEFNSIIDIFSNKYDLNIQSTKG